METRKRFFSERTLKGLRDYFVQVSLIILSLLVAVGVDRCNTARKNEQKLQAYLEAIHHDLAYESEKTVQNLFDANKDITALENGLTQFAHNNNDSLQAGIMNVGQVLLRGVFRTFSPTTFDVMSKTGDLLLIKDLELRERLASVFAFRTNVIKRDLELHDAMTIEVAESMGAYFDLNCLVERRAVLDCLHDREGLVSSRHNKLLAFQLECQQRAFHLSVMQHLVNKATELMPERKGESATTEATEE